MYQESGGKDQTDREGSRQSVREVCVFVCELRDLRKSLRTLGKKKALRGERCAIKVIRVTRTIKVVRVIRFISEINADPRFKLAFPCCAKSSIDSAMSKQRS